jgi:uncharacterized protein (DUF2225 family)
MGERQELTLNDKMRNAMHREMEEAINGMRKNTRRNQDRVVQKIRKKYQKMGVKLHAFS